MTAIADANHGIDVENDEDDLKYIEMDFPSQVFNRRLKPSFINTEITNMADYSFIIK